MKKAGVWKIAGVYASVIIGAGFASGQELLKFFANYGPWGSVGIVVSGTIFAFAGWAIMDICHKKGIGYKELIDFSMGKRLGAVVEIASAFFMYVLYATMMAGVGATLNQAHEIPFSIGVVCAAGVTFIAMMFDLDGLVAINSLLAPVLVVGGLLVGLFAFLNRTTPTSAFGQDHAWIASAVIYASYNMVTSVPVLAALGKNIPSSKAARGGALLGGGLMTVLGLFMIYPIYVYYFQATQAEVPLLAIASNFSWIFEQFYLVILLCAIFTTAISNGFGIVSWATDSLGVSPVLAKAVLSISSCLFAHIGFSMFVSNVYPLFSAIGMLELSAIFAAWKRVSRKTAPQGA
ncbi:MAG: hypothetical protein LBC41_03705 [Clostridiales bacterium]|jgi:uncharacterized membrane protein YkvI|nr:hypothetical protein [Clostridiales bacterium]